MTNLSTTHTREALMMLLHVLVRRAGGNVVVTPNEAKTLPTGWSEQEIVVQQAPDGSYHYDLRMIVERKKPSSILVACALKIA